ncbi:MAG: DUF1343 domain-containing protein [Sandaracinaceae bacterium]|nr:DUF1343 domain-containing protein [Sandaracinaceae bacterium]
MEPAVEPAPSRPVPVAIRISAEHEDAIDALVDDAIQAGAAPGCVIVLGRRDGVVFRRAYGQRAVDPAPEPMTVDTVFDLASITKAAATAASVMVLVERGDLDLDARASRYLPAIPHAFTVRQLLLHTSGLPPVDALRDYGEDRAANIERIARTPLERPPGARVRYSDLGYVLLGEIVARVGGAPLEAFAREHVHAPLGMIDTGYVPDRALWPRVAPTERAERRGGVMIRGVVHDPRAWRLGGVAGHAGLFSTADDLARLARRLLGEGDGWVTDATIAQMTAPQALPGGSRALGWDTGRAGMSARAFGHGGYTGTSLWMDPVNDVFVILLSNRVHPNGEGDVQPLVRALGPLGVAATRAAAPPSTGAVLAGVDVLERDGFASLAGARVALLTHRAARTRDGRRTLDVLHAAPDVTVVRVLSPEHGLGSDREGRIEDGRDARTGLPVLGLFGRTRSPTPAMLAGIDTIVVDLQDVGVRFYTYASTVRRVLEAAAAAGLRVVVLDRPDPLGGGPPRGPVSEPALASFVNHHPLPAMHGMTLGELATLLNAERSIDARLDVIELEGWARPTPFEATGLRWVPSSPNLRTTDEVRLYPMLGLLEGTNVSVGRGTETPFEVIGAPWVDGEALVRAIGPLPGLRVEPVTFTPRSTRHRGERCGGARFTITDPTALRPVRGALAIARALRVTYPDGWEPERMVRAIGSQAVFDAFLAGESTEALEARWAPGLERFEALRGRYLRYP